MKNYSHNSKNMKKREPKLEAAAKKVMRDINRHFKTDGWNLDLGSQIDEVFSKAFGYNLEEHLIPKLLKKYDLRSVDGRLVISLKKGRRK